MPTRDGLGSDFDPTAAETMESAHAEMARLRSTCPVAHSTAFEGFWALLRHADVVDVLRAPGTFVTSVQNVVPRVSFTGRRPPLHLDPPEHTPYRQVINQFFTDERMRAFAPAVDARVAELVEPYVAAGGGDVCTDVTRRLPGYVFADFFHLSTEQAMAIKATSEVYNRALQVFDEELVKRTSLELYDLARDIIESRTATPMDPHDDLTSALLAKRVDGEPLPRELVLGTIRQLIVVGMIAPSVFIGTMLAHLAEHKQLQQQLRDDLSLVPAAIEEYLRLYTPYRGFARTAVRDVMIGGREIRKDEPIALVYASANRDPEVFADPDEFVLDRPNIDEHVAFGRGPHRCAGEGLARLLLRSTLEALLSATSRIELVGEPAMTRWPEWGTVRADFAVWR